MIVDYEAFNKGYLKKDNWNIGADFLPFVTNAGLKFSKKTGLDGLTGTFIRLQSDRNIKPITDFDESLYLPVYDYLTAENIMPDYQIRKLKDILKDLFWPSEDFNIIDSYFLKYLPVLPKDESFSELDKEKYQKGIDKIAEYLCSFSRLAIKDLIANTNHKINNEIINIVCDSLKYSEEKDNKVNGNTKKRNNVDYIILPFIKESFNKDLVWFISQENDFKVKYFSSFLHFYACYSIIQTITKANIKKKIAIDKPTEFYFMFKSETASANHDAVTKGWSYQISDADLKKMFGKFQALDIANTILGKNIGFLPDILAKLNETPFDDNKMLCEKILGEYQDKARKKLLARPSEKNKPSWNPIDVAINSYEEFFQKLSDLCISLQSDSFSRIGNYVKDFVSMQFLQTRRNYKVLVLDNEMLLFLIAMMSKKNNGECINLECLYKMFKSYGIYFNKSTRNEIEEYLLKLNLLDRKSDAGEAQYVRIIL